MRLIHWRICTLRSTPNPVSFVRGKNREICLYPVQKDLQELNTLLTQDTLWWQRRHGSPGIREGQQELLAQGLKLGVSSSV